MSNIELKIHMPMELLYSLFAAGTKKHFYSMIKDFDMEPNDEIIKAIELIEINLSDFMKNELEYFFDLSGLGYIMYKYILYNPHITEVTELLDIINKYHATDLVFKIVESVCKNNLPEKDTADYILLKKSTKEMLKLVEATKFQDEKRFGRVVESIKNPEETKQRLYLLVSQFYNRCFKPIEKHIIDIINSRKDIYYTLLNENSSKFIVKYLNLELYKNTDVTVHLSFFKYISWHHYSLYTEKLKDWFVLGIYSDLLYDENIISEKFSNVFKALSDPNRIEILKLLNERAWYMQELAEKLNITPPTISYHMTFLQRAGIVNFSRMEKRSYYSLNNSKLTKLLADFSSFFN